MNMDQEVKSGKLEEEQGQTNKKDNSSGTYMTEGMCIGMCFGPGIGLLLFSDYWFMGILGGMCLGMFIGSCIKKKKKKSS